MNRWRNVLVSAFVGGFAVLTWCGPAAGLIQVDFPVSKICAASKTVLIGTIDAVRSENRVVSVKVAEALKGAAAGDSFRVQIVQPAGLIQKVAVNQPVVLFIGEAKGKPVGIVHLADTWLLASALPGAGPPAWRVGDVYQGAKSFPGRTRGLAAAVRMLLAGKPALLNSVEHNVFRGGPHELADVMGQASWLLAADVNADGKDDVLLGSGQRVQLLISDGKGVADATAGWALGGAKAAWAAAGDLNGDGKCDLLFGRSVWINQGSAFNEAKDVLDAPAGEPIAVGIGDLTGDGKADVAVLTADGQVEVFQNPAAEGAKWKKLPARRLWAGGPAPAAAALAADWGDTGRLGAMVVRPDGLTRYALDEGGAPPTDFAGLTGFDIAPFAKSQRTPGGWDVLGAAPIDINGDGRMDLLVVTDGRSHGPLLVNRGFGAFLINPDASGAVSSRGRSKMPWGRLTAEMLVASGDLHGDRFDDLLIATKQGKLYELSNTPFPQHP